MQKTVDITPMGFIDFGVDNNLASYGIGLGVNNTNYLIVRNDGRIFIPAGNQSTSTTTGAQVIAGGQAVGGNQYIGGFTSLGDNIAIKKRLLLGTSPSNQGSITETAHGLNSAKIVSVSILVEWSTGQFVSDKHNYNMGFEFDTYISTFSIGVTLRAGNSFNILEKPVRILIDYTA